MIDGPIRRAWPLAATLVLLLAAACTERQELGTFPVQSMLEDRLPDGRLFTPSTQSFLRGEHWLENVDEVQISRQGYQGTFDLRTGEPGQYFRVESFPIDQAVARLHYMPASPPDEFDAYNLMMAEFSRNGLSVPVGQPSDTMARFETSLDVEIPWTLAGDYEFVPAPRFRPHRVALVNNCLRAGLWEISAGDRAGEIYHAWFTFGTEAYAQLVAEVNGIDESFAAEALEWSTEKRRLELDRLRRVIEELGRFPISRTDQDAPMGYSSQDSRRKLSQRYVQVERAGQLSTPENLGELVALPIRMNDFVEPGRYSYTDRKPFDLAFLAEPEGVEVRRVEPLTHYSWRNPSHPIDHEGATHLELTIDLGDRRLVLGNLPVPLLVRQEDYVIHGFGVGVLSSLELAERRRYLIERGPAPSYAYLAEPRDGVLYGLNSHDAGIEQIFLRTLPFGAEPHWTIAITSFERIVDLVKYRVPIPPALIEELQQASREYVSPLYYTYADDNVR